MTREEELERRLLVLEANYQREVANCARERARSANLQRLFDGAQRMIERQANKIRKLEKDPACHVFKNFGGDD